MILFQNISKKYGDNLVIDDIHLAIEGGEFVTLVGPSGAGKTTLINILIGAEKPDFGTVTVDDYDITAMNARTLQAYRRKIGVAFQDYKLLPRKTVAENISFVLEVCGYQKSDIQHRVVEALETVNLLHRMHQFPSELSGGEKQKTSIARAIVHDPRLLIADEPTGNLDPESTREIIEILLKIHAQDRTILLASHNKDMVNFINKRVVALRNGKITSDEQGGLYDLEAIHGDMSDKYLEIHIDSEL